MNSKTIDYEGTLPIGNEVQPSFTEVQFAAATKMTKVKN